MDHTITHNNKSTKRILWTRLQLLVAYHIAKYGIKPLATSTNEICETYRVGRNSLAMQVANFKSMMELEYSKYNNKSKNKRLIIDECKKLKHQQLIQLIELETNPIDPLFIKIFCNSSSLKLIDLSLKN